MHTYPGGGSEKHTAAAGKYNKQGVSISPRLLALGNISSAPGDSLRAKAHMLHMPYCAPRRAAGRRDGIAAVLARLRAYTTKPSSGAGTTHKGWCDKVSTASSRAASSHSIKEMDVDGDRIGSTSSPWSSLDADEDDGGHMQRSLRRAMQGIGGMSSSGSMPELRPRKGHH
ncbi:hypothetical protein B0H14DRAFT_3494595 [Mycena olivaceomarginata]|nr:hypothetical protein B0H14DRAFT_3494595 [Mycena olivaceomarginata]